MDTFETFMHHFSHLPTLHPVSQPYTRSTTTICTRCSLQVRKTQHINISSQIVPNVWILTTEPSTVTPIITLICLGETKKFITVKNPSTSCNYHQQAAQYHHTFIFHSHYEHPALTANISLDIANLNMVNISSLGFHIWQHLKDKRNETQLHHLSSIPSLPIAQLYKHMISGIKPITPFTSPNESIGDTKSIWTLFSHTGIYV